MTSPTPQAAAAILATERARITSVIDKRIAEWWQLHHEYGDPDFYFIASELDYIKGVVNASEEKRQADHPGD